MNYAVISSDKSPTYSFFAPLCSLFWTRRGFRPLLVLVGTAEEWLADPRRRLELERSREVGAVVHFMPYFHGADGMFPGGRPPTATAAQCARLFASSLPGVQADDYLLTGDVDMLTLGPWVGGAVDARPLQLYFSNAYSSGPCPHDGGKTNPCPCFPICYIGAQAKIWREIVGTDIGAALNAAPVGADDAMLLWNHDEKWLGQKIRSWYGFPTLTQQIERNFDRGQWRLDRSDWKVGDAAWRAEHEPFLHGVADAHLPRPGYTDEVWPTIRPLLEAALPKKLVAWCDDYREAWVNA